LGCVAGVGVQVFVKATPSWRERWWWPVNVGHPSTGKTLRSLRRAGW
jgi:hypothetical protein